jgi:endonuclease/exonuclease/phosphatase family metal-dependent hydrolase
MCTNRYHLIALSILFCIIGELNSIILPWLGSVEKIAAKRELRLMTINVWSGLDYKGTLKMGEYESPEMQRIRFLALIKEIKLLSPDVVAINEANFLPDYVEQLAEKLGYSYVHHVGVSGLHIWRIGIPWNLKEGDAILARKDLNLRYVGRKQLSGDGFVLNNFSFHTQDATQVLVGKITWNGRDIYIAVTHWHASPRDDSHSQKLLLYLMDRWKYTQVEYRTAVARLKGDNKWRINESRLMASYLKEVVPEGAPVILMGDFNAEINWPEMKYFLDDGFYDTFSLVSKGKGLTWDPERNSNIIKFYRTNLNKKFKDIYEHLNAYNEHVGKRIDLILINRAIPGVSVIESRLCADRLRMGVHPSDHFGVFTVLRWEKSPQR